MGRIRGGAALGQRFCYLRHLRHLRCITKMRQQLASCMATISRMNQARELRRRWWRFSLRELLLVMLAVAGFLGWGALLYESYQRFEPTPFYLESMDWREAVAAALEEVGEKSPPSSDFASTQIWGRSADQCTMAYRFRLDSAKNVAFYQALRSRIRGRMTAAGCVLGGSAESNSGASQAMAVTYRLGSNAGAVNVSYFPSDGSHARVVISMHEQRGGRGGLSAGASGGRGSADE